jgi:hypothetical protein
MIFNIRFACSIYLFSGTTHQLKVNRLFASSFVGCLS